MPCEACGGDGLIEVGAYRGDDSDIMTRECRLCGGAVTVTTKAANAVAQLAQSGVTVAQASEGLRRLVHRSSEDGRRTADLVIEADPETEPEHRHFWDVISGASNIAGEMAFRCNSCGEVMRLSDNGSERRQQEPESATNSEMNELIREGRLQDKQKYRSGF